MSAILGAFVPVFAEGIDARPLVYLASLFVASMLFILGLRGLTHADTARRGQAWGKSQWCLSIAREHPVEHATH